MKKAAFTLVEVLIVVSIIALLTAIAIPNFLRAGCKDPKNRHSKACQQLANHEERRSGCSD